MRAYTFASKMILLGRMPASGNSTRSRRGRSGRVSAVSFEIARREKLDAARRSAGSGSAKMHFDGFQ